MNFNLNWDRSIIDLMVPGEKTKRLWSSRTSQLVRNSGNQNQSIQFMHRMTIVEKIYDSLLPRCLLQGGEDP
jgi:hypothetical protein